jgi:hypothetical protein
MSVTWRLLLQTSSQRPVVGRVAPEFRVPKPLTRGLSEAGNRQLSRQTTQMRAAARRHNRWRSAAATDCVELTDGRIGRPTRLFDAYLGHGVGVTAQLRERYAGRYADGD